MNVLDEIVQDQIRTDLPELASGDTVKVSAKVVEGNRERIQVFEGTVMRLRGGGITRTITVRRIASGVGVERTFKINSPRIEKIEVVRHGVARRAQLYFLRDRVGKAATLRERRPQLTAAGRPDRHLATPSGGRGRLDVPPAPDRPSVGYPSGRWRPSSRPSATSAATGEPAGTASSGSTRSASRPPADRWWRRPWSCPGTATGSPASATRRRSRRPSASGSPRSSAVGRVAVGVGAASVEEIDRLNIYHATHLAMRRAIARVGDPRPRPGRRPPDPRLRGRRRAVHRDRRRRRPVLFDRLCVGRGQGGPRPAHDPALGRAIPATAGSATPATRRSSIGPPSATLGVTPFHRRSFAPIQEALLGVEQGDPRARLSRRDPLMRGHGPRSAIGSTTPGRPEPWPSAEGGRGRAELADHRAVVVRRRVRVGDPGRAGWSSSR